VRPLQIFSRQDTARLCDQNGWPVWIDPGNADPRLSRNRIRAAVLPVLEELHPGAARRISAQAERLAGELEQRQELLDLALMAVASSGDGDHLDRHALLRLSTVNQGSLLQHWLRQRWGHELDARTLQNLLPRLPSRCGPGHLDLAGGWQLRWQSSKLALMAPPHPHEPSHG
jgi:tRNA(Ile)-lysidine synthase